MNTQIFNSLFTIVNFLNDPKRDANLLREAGIKEDKNLLPIIVRVGARGTTSVGELANQLGKNHSSTSRQIDKFVKDGILSSTQNNVDKRIRSVSLTEDGQKIYDMITITKERVMDELFSQLTEQELAQIAESLKKVSDILTDSFEKKIDTAQI